MKDVHQDLAKAADAARRLARLFGRPLSWDDLSGLRSVNADVAPAKDWRRAHESGLGYLRPTLILVAAPKSDPQLRLEYRVDGVVCEADEDALGRVAAHFSGRMLCQPMLDDLRRCLRDEHLEILASVSAPGSLAVRVKADRGGILEATVPVTTVSRLVTDSAAAAPGDAAWA